MHFPILQDNKRAFKINEFWLHSLWKHQQFFDERLVTVKGSKLKVIFPGWYNRGWGPDFKDSKIELNGSIHFGDIEIHLEESAWNQHAHQMDPAYNKVILHVFLNKGAKRVKNQFNQNIESLHLKREMMSTHTDSISKTSVDISDIPGACGLMLGTPKLSKLKSVIFQASQSRTIEKSNQFDSEIRKNDLEHQEDVLFSSICNSLGYSSNSYNFKKLSERFPYSKIRKFFNSTVRQTRIEILSRWLGYLGIFNNMESSSMQQDIRREWVALQQRWELIKGDSLVNPLACSMASRPLNNPVRRLFGLFYHLEKIQFHGLVKSWLAFFSKCEKEVSANKPKKSDLLRILDDMFPQPDWDPLNYSISGLVNHKELKKSKLIGQKRQLIILINSIIPFFIAWARAYDDKKLEKTIFSLLLFLPNEGGNKKTQFMENRLFDSIGKNQMTRNLYYQQGLIQLHDDCCTSFYEGCDNCTLLKMLA